MAKAKSATQSKSGTKGSSARGGGASTRPSSGGASRKGGMSPRSGASRRGVVKGEGLEVGTPRRESGDAGPLPRATTKRAAKTPLQLPGEKAITPTRATIPVEPRRKSPGDGEPMPDAAVDRRRQIVGTDDKGRRGRR